MLCTFHHVTAESTISSDYTTRQITKKEKLGLKKFLYSLLFTIENMLHILKKPIEVNRVMTTAKTIAKSKIYKGNTNRRRQHTNTIFFKIDKTMLR